MKRLLAVALSALLAGAVDLDRARLEAEAVPLLQALVRADTTNPPGNETIAARLMQQWLAKEGIQSEVVGPTPERGSLVARLKGDGTEPPLLLLSHLDVVPVEAAKWRHPPFGAVLADGAIWGRGTIDTKGLTAMQLLAFLDLERRNVPLRRDVILCAVADEEAGGDAGAVWLLKNRPDLVTASEVFNEGGGGLAFPGGKRAVAIATAERGVFQVRVIARGMPGHGSLERPDGATRRLIRALARLEAAPRHVEMVPETRDFLKALGPLLGGFQGWFVSNLDFPGALALFGPRLGSIDPLLATWIGNTVNTTVLAAGQRVNVMPGEAAAEIDMRLLPGYSTEQAREFLAATFADPGIEIVPLARKEPSRSEGSGRLYEAMKAAIAAEYPDAAIAQILIGWGTDCAHFRSPTTRCFGLNPFVLSREQVNTFHGHDERITVEQLVSGTRVVMRAVEQAAMR
ncbi:MAG: M20/M25/M40 family metallo-hydrolase [Candidatus Sericytochromatia bacterium]|nr:M20/M25/M40 family metallo-hydrolase [Candidatus Tanganyikabacteria bacterium]